MCEKFNHICDIIDQYVNENREQILRLGRELFCCPELGFKEVNTGRIITSFLRENGIPCEEGISLTGVRATLGAGDGYHIALAADMDAVEAGAGAERRPIHSCGHSIQVAVMLWAMKLFKDTGLLNGLPGRVTFLAAPAEEFLDFPYREALRARGEIKYFSGKQNMISDGVFDGVDCVISAHVNGEREMLFDVDSTLAGFMVKKVTFTGRTAHAGVAPHLGKNALHGASLFLDAVSYLKEQFPPEAGIRIHPVISSCGGSVNSIPDQVTAESYIRANDMDRLLEAGRLFDGCAEHCAAALGLSCSVETTNGYLPLKQSAELNEVILGQMRRICGDGRIARHVVSGASGDVGDLSFLLPTVQFGFSGIEGRIHSDEFEICQEDHAYCDTLKVAAGTVMALLTEPGLQVKRPGYRERKEFYLRNWLREAAEENHNL